MDTPDVATTPFYDAFISYGRADSKAFATQLYQRLLAQGFTVWLDQNDIPLGVDFQAQIDDGLEKAHNFLFIIAPHSVNSPYCGKEIDLSLSRNKRILPLLHVEQISRETWQNRNPNGTDEQWAEYQAKGLHSSFPNMHPEIGKINWVYFREGIDDFEQSLTGLVEIFQRHRGYVEQHTTLLAQALEWERNQKRTRYLLVGEDRERAEVWLKHRFQEEQAPCNPTPLHCEYICESIKNANNLMTQVFLSHAEVDRTVTEQMRALLLREGITVWISSRDIQTGELFEAAIDRGIEQTDTVVYLLSPASLQSDYCQRELGYAFSLNKRIIPLLIAPIDVEQIPPNLRSLQFIDFTDNKTEVDDQRDIDQLLKALREDGVYYEDHKILLVQALKWERQNRNPTILLRGYNLRRAEDWLKGARLRSQHPPTALQETFINESLRQPPLTSLDVFISYSRADSELARRLNEELQLRGKTTWFDQESIASGADFQQEIYQGIKSADNFLFILSPRSINSPYCADEVEYAANLNKRFVTLLYQGVNPAELHPDLAKVQWIDFSPSGGDFSASVNRLVRTLETDREHIHSHTKWSLRSLEWQNKDRSEDMLLRGSERVAAATWLQQALQENQQPPPTELQQAFITASTALHDRLQQQEQERQRKELQTARRTTVGAIAFSVVALSLAIYAYGQQQRAEQQTKIAQVREQAARVLNWLPTARTAEALVLAIDTINQSQALPDVSLTAQSSLLKAVQEAQEVNQMHGHTDLVISVAFSPDGKRVVSGSFDKTVRIWDAQTGQAIGQPLKGHTDLVVSVAFSPDGKRIISGSFDHTVRIWDAQTGQAIGQPLKGHTDNVVSVAYSPDGTRIVSGSQDKTLRLWDAQTGQQIGQPLKGHTDWVVSVDYSSDGQRIISGSFDGTVRIWDAKTGHPINQPLKGHTNPVYSVAYSPDSKQIISGSSDGTLRLWNAQTGQAINQPLKGHTSTVFSVAYSPDGKQIISGSSDGTVRVWNAQTGQAIGPPLKGHTDTVNSVAYSPDGSRIASGSYDRTVRIWDAQTGQPIGQLLQGHTEAVVSMAYSPDGKRIVSGRQDNILQIRDAQTGQLIGRTLTGHKDPVYSVVYSPDGKRIVSGSQDNTLRIWDAQTEQSVGPPLQGSTGDINSVVYSPDGKHIASSSYDRIVRIWDAQTGQLIDPPLQGHTDVVNSVVYSPDGKRIVTGSQDNTLRLWNAQTGQPIGPPLKGHTDIVSAVAYSPDGKHIASGSRDKTLRIWDAQTGQPISPPLQGHTGRVNSVAYSPDGKHIVSGSQDKTLRIWDAQTGQPIGPPLQGYTDEVLSVVYSPDGKRIVSVSGDNTVQIWDPSPATWLAIACDRLQHHPLLNRPEALSNDPEFLQVAQRARAVCQR